MEIILEPMTSAITAELCYENDREIAKFMRLSVESKRKLLLLINKDVWLWFVAKNQGEIVGDIIAEMDCGEVSVAVRIAEKYRGQGVLKIMVDSLIELLRDRYSWDFNMLFAGISSENNASKKAFAKLGFKNCGENDGIAEFTKSV